MGRFDAPGYGRGRAGRGRHPGGRGVGFGPGRGNGGARGPSIASSSYQLTAEQKEAMLVPFLRPSPRALVPVPLEFESVRHFCDLIANNLLAEFWHLIQEGPRGPAVKATPAAGGGLRVTSGDATGDGENAAHHLLLIERRLHLVVSQSGGTVNAATGEKTPCVLQLRPKLQGPHQGPVRSFGYVGAFVAELAALQELALRDARGEAGSPALRAMLKPREAVAGHWHPPPLPEEDFARIAASRGVRGANSSHSRSSRDVDAIVHRIRRHRDIRSPRTLSAASCAALLWKPPSDVAASARTFGCDSSLASSRCFLAVAPMRPGAPTTSISASHARSFCAMLSMATLREHVTRTLAPGGTRCVMTW